MQLYVASQQLANEVQDWADHGDLDKPIQEAIEFAPQSEASNVYS